MKETEEFEELTVTKFSSSSNVISILLIFIEKTHTIHTKTHTCLDILAYIDTATRSNPDCDRQ